MPLEFLLHGQLSLKYSMLAVRILLTHVVDRVNPRLFLTSYLPFLVTMFGRSLPHSFLVILFLFPFVIVGLHSSSQLFLTYPSETGAAGASRSFLTFTAFGVSDR